MKRKYERRMICVRANGRRKTLEVKLTTKVEKSFIEIEVFFHENFKLSHSGESQVTSKSSKSLLIVQQKKKQKGKTFNKIDRSYC